MGIKTKGSDLKMAQLKFMDVSHFDNEQGPIDWDQLSKSVDGFTVKITEGTTFVDPKGAENFANAKKTGKPVGGYHFFHGQGKEEADFFKSKLPDVDLLQSIVRIQSLGILQPKLLLLQKKWTFLLCLQLPGLYQVSL
jgi:GH25 family lysozyme M1 (1,4-beta-N-acetylmuramidase)